MIARTAAVCVALLTAAVHAQDAQAPDPVEDAAATASTVASTVVPPAPPPPDPVTTAIEQTYTPATRAAGITTLEQSWQRAHDPRTARLALARALSWEGRLDEAVAHYNGVLAERAEVEIELERLRVLGWLGRTADAEAGYRAVLAAHPESAAAHAGLAKMQRWQGRLLSAVASARRATELSANDTNAREELVLAYAALGLPFAARDALRPARSPSAEAVAAIARADRTELSVSTVATSDSFGVQRLAPRVNGSWMHDGDIRVQVGGGSTHVRGMTDNVDYGVVALRIAKVSPRLELGIGGAAYSGIRLLLGEASGTARVRAHDAVKLFASVRRRPYLENAEPLTTGEAAFFEASSGATMPAAVARRGVDEVRLAGNAAPHAALYVYVDARAMRLSDSNTGYTIASGLGLDVLRLLGGGSRFALLARIDNFATGYNHARPDYFSPARFHSEQVAGQAVLRLDSTTLTAYAGANVSIGGIAVGWTTGGAVDVRTQSITLQARGERRDDLASAAVRGWLAISAGW